MLPRPSHGNGRIANHLLVRGAQPERILIKLNRQIGDGDIARNVAHVELELDGAPDLAESGPEFDAAGFFGGADLGHARFGLRGGGGGGGSAEEIAHSAAAAVDGGSIVVHGKASHVEKIHSTTATAALVDIILILVLLLFIPLLNLFSDIPHAQIPSFRGTALGPHHERLGRLVINTRKGGNLAHQHIQQIRLQPKGIILDHGLVPQHHQLGRLGIRGQQPPVDESPIPQVGVVALLRGQVQHPLDHVLRLLRIFEEAFDGGREELELHRGVFLLERFEEGVQELVGVVDAFGVLANDPDHGCFGLGLVQGVEVVAEGGNDALVTVGITAEDVLDHDDGLLNDIVDLGLDEFQEDTDTTLRSTFELDSTPPNRRDGLAHKVHIHLGSILLQLQQHLINIPLRHQLDDNLQLLHLDINRIIILAKEHLDLILQNARTFLDNQVDIPQRHVLNLRLGIEQRHQRRGQFARQCPQTLGMGSSPRSGIPAHDIHIRQDHFYGAHDHGTIGMLQPRRHPFDNPLGLPCLRRSILRE
mmetsp:Transcript_6699/g.11728  ORF Transcript_6699/g.11728 Transcript_6699/m.11728 type:complete len:532 (+) Transcript_6699:656-2251(+)